ncbi:MAG: phosphatidate cytidylyltransferase [Flavobacteriales bacterium]|nr:phosphatidate cytidylyltransferase [Flavobacteriales bacterium]
MSEFTKRAITGAVYVSLTLGAAIIGPWTTFLLFLPVCVIAAREWHRLFHAPGESDPGEGRSMLLAAVVFTAFGVVPMSGWSTRAGAAVIFAMLVLLAFDIMRRGIKDPAHAFAGLLAVVLYVAVPFTCVTWMVEIHWHVFVGFMFLLWTSDTGAYLVGRSFGRNKLMPLVSPGKTWEGLAGGVALTLLVGWLLARSWNELSSSQWLLGAVVVAVTATLGDLLESAFKRARGVKDSGNILPGHGGILDRFDGFLLAAPAMLVTLRLMEQVRL